MVAEKKAPDRRPATRSDLLVNRITGLGIILIGAALAYSLIFTTFEHRVTFQWEFVNGERTPITHITCPAPWSVLSEDARPEGVVSGDLCVKPARGQVVQGIGVAIAALAIGGWLFTRDLRRKPLPPLPPSVRARGRGHRLDYLERRMADIEIRALSDDTFEVIIDETSTHLVTATEKHADLLCNGCDRTHLVEASIRFLLDREPKESIANQFDLDVIARYFPDYPSSIDGYL